MQILFLQTIARVSFKIGTGRQITCLRHKKLIEAYTVVRMVKMQRCLYVCQPAFTIILYINNRQARIVSRLSALSLPIYTWAFSDIRVFLRDPDQSGNGPLLERKQAASARQFHWARSHSTYYIASLLFFIVQAIALAWYPLARSHLQLFWKWRRRRRAFEQTIAPRLMLYRPLRRFCANPYRACNGYVVLLSVEKTMWKFVTESRWYIPSNLDWR